MKDHLRTLLVFVVLGIAAWKLYSDYIVAPQHTAVNVPVAIPLIEIKTSRALPVNHNTCDGSKYCSEMHSGEEAAFFIKNCPDTEMHADDEGIPCENDPRF
jgi:hypothetical protein